MNDDRTCELETDTIAATPPAAPETLADEALDAVAGGGRPALTHGIIIVGG